MVDSGCLGTRVSLVGVVENPKFNESALFNTIFQQRCPIDWAPYSGVIKV